MEVNIIIGAVSFIVIVILLLQVKKVKSEATKIEQKYSVIIDVDKEVDKKRTDLAKDEAESEQKIDAIKKDMGELKTKYQHASDAFTDLSHKNNLLQDNLDVADYGIYEPHFDFDTSEKYKEQIKDIRDEQKRMIKDKNAVLGGEGMTFNGSVAKGRTMTNKQKKLMLRAFNGECDSFISNVQWNNATRMKERILKSAEAITKTAELEKLSIAKTYIDFKITELELAYEYKSKKHDEQEEQRRVKEQMREEAKAQKEIEKALKDAEKEEKLINDALKAAKEQMESASEEQKAEFEAKLAELQDKLLVAEESNKRALSMAQQTKSGHVYVISN
ncbi:MAG: DUF4041 domain-containing protein, partial [Candidatus Kapabacteria bacterium]|nr:DUF4041 domain-containing protein [Candidatus Kapabacteria bacterium]